VAWVVILLSTFVGRTVTLFVLVLSSNTSVAGELRIEVVGLFKDRAAIVVDGKQYFIKKGESILGDISLVSSTTEKAVISVGGVTQELKLESRIGGFLEKPASKEVVIWKSPQGMFLTVGSINGFPVNFLVDTGATKVALNRRDAKRYGVVLDETSQKVMVSTASGHAPAFLVKLNKVRVGDIALRSVDAIVMEGEHPRKILLGMSFLNRVDFQQSGRKLKLTTK
jgi:aspartyl protease family protein